MKTAAIALIMLVTVVCGAVADDSSPPPATIESIISSLPTQSEREHWKSCSEEQRKSPTEAELAQKIRNTSANCQQLQSRIIEGKPLADYPGLLTRGFLIWNDSAKAYLLKVQSGFNSRQGTYGGFMCTFDPSFNVVRVSPLTWMF